MIYCVEDDEGIRNMMVYTLNASGLEAEGFEGGEAFFRALEAQKPKLVILDIMLPGEDGIQILKRLRSHPATAALPVMMASAKGTEFDKVLGLDLGADDYLAKPFGMMEMTSRVKALLRRSTSQREGQTLRQAGIEMRLEEHSVYVKGQRVELTLKEYELLRVLMESPGRVYTRDQLLYMVWDTDYDGGTRTVDVHIRTLRTKLGTAGESILTVRGVGYRMEAST